MCVKKAVWSFVLGLLPAVLWAGDGGGRAGFEFLRTEMGARPAAMGGAFVAVAGDLHGLAYNPASLAGTRPVEATFTYLDHFLDIKSGFLGFAKSLKRTGRLGVGVFYINYGELQRRDIAGEEIGSFVPGDYVLSVAYADNVFERFRYGVSVKYIYSKIDTYAASGLAVDLGLLYRIPSQDLDVGLAVQNVGRSIDAFIDTHEKLPMAYRLGCSKRLAHLPLLLSFNLIRYAYHESDLFWGLYWALGGEFTITDYLFLRWGYNSRGQEEKMGSGNDWFTGASLGLGIRYGRYGLDYGYGSYGVLGSMNQLTLTVHFD